MYVVLYRFLLSANLFFTRVEILTRWVCNRFYGFVTAFMGL